MITSDQLKDLLERADALNHYLNIDQKKVEYEEPGGHKCKHSREDENRRG